MNELPYRDRGRTFRERCALLPLLLVVVLFASGCTRKFFRNSADDEVFGLLNEKNQYEFWAINNFRIYPDERARFADPANPDRPPRPPDDPAADYLSPNPQPPRKAGVGFFEGDVYLRYIAKWDEQNRIEVREKKERAAALLGSGIQLASFQEAKKDDKKDPADPPVEPATPPSTTEYAETGGTDRGYDRALASSLKTYLIKLEQAIELGLFNNREYQDRCEDLYAAALPVTLERFAFVTQFFAVNQTIREYVGIDRRDGIGAGDRWNSTSDVGFTKLFPTGATMLFRLANQLVVEFGEGQPNIGITTLTLELAQPFLRGGGYAVTLEPLTQAERNLLYAIRSFARFRKIWFVYMAAGGTVFNDPLSFAGLALRGIGPNFTAPGQGFMPTVLLQGLQRNEEANVIALERILKLFDAFKEGGDISDLQVGQVEQQLLRSRASLLQRRADFQDGLDRLKLQLGVPTRLPLELDDSVLRPISQQFTSFQRVFDEYDAVRVRAAQAGAPDAVDKVRPALHDLSTGAAIVKGTRFAKDIGKRWEYWEKLTNEQIDEELKKLAARRRALLDLRADYDVKRQPFPAEEADRLRQLESDIDIGEFEQSLRRYESKLWLKEQTPERRLRTQQAMFREVADSFVLILADARNERLGQIRESWPDLPPLCVNGVNLLEADLDQAMAVTAQTALSYRLDLMNERARVVDAWREVAVQANSLLGVANLRYHLDSVTPDGLNRPFAFSADRTRHQLILNTELPLVRLPERNEYRIALIALQRQRRALMAAEDFVLNGVRTELRQLRVLAENYKIQQRAVELAYSQVENALDTFSSPPIPTAQGGGGNNAGNAAALTNQLLNAQQSLPQAQNALYTVWINYMTVRMQLYRDLELMPLDSRGVWTDECVTRDCPPESATPERVSPGDTGNDAPNQLPAPTPRIGELPRPVERKDP